MQYSKQNDRLKPPDLSVRTPLFFPLLGQLGTEAVKELLSTFLKERGLELSEEKTLVTHIDDGFDFLGWNFRKHRNQQSREEDTHNQTFEQIPAIDEDLDQGDRIGEGKGEGSG